MIRKLLLFVILPLFLLLQACSNTLQKTGLPTYYTDSNIQFQLLQQLKRHPNLYNKNHIVTAVYHRVVLIAGQVLEPGQRIQVQQMAQNIPGVARVYNELQISGSTTTLTRSSDSWITSKVAAKMISVKNLASRNIKVVTENGTVYLMGNVSQSQAQMAETVARKVPGVQKVVSLFGGQ